MNTITDEQFIGPQAHLSRPARLRPLRPRLNSSRRFRAANSAMEVALGGSTPERKATPAESPRGDMFRLYLREIGQVKLLGPEEEIGLAERIKRGDDGAREQMIKANLRLVVKIARDYEGLGVPLLDLISEGNIGLIKGVERFKPTKGAKLSTYAAWWIKQSIKRALANQSKTIRLPVHVARKIAHIREAEHRLRETLDREATDEEVADDLGIDPRRLRQYHEASRAPVCLDSPMSSEDSTTISEAVADENAAAPFDELIKENDHRFIHEVLASLDARESKILAMGFGLDDGRLKTLDEISEYFSVSRDRIRQVQKEALQEMRAKIEKRGYLSKPVSSRSRAFTA